MTEGALSGTPTPPYTFPEPVVTVAGPLLPLIRQLYIGQLGSSSSTLYTAPAPNAVANPLGIEPKTVIEEIWLCNTDTAARLVTMYLVESGGSAADNRAIFKDLLIQPKESYQVTGKFVLEASGTIRGLSDVASRVTVAISGTEYA